MNIKIMREKEKYSAWRNNKEDLGKLFGEY